MKGIIDLTILGIDTSGKTASVALCRDDEVLAQTTVLTNLTHSQVILPLCKEMMKNAGKSLEDIDGIAVCDGPGSYTGLRIGISAVKAISYALNKPCIGISTLESLAYNFFGIKGTICAVMSARQNLVYTATFFFDGEDIKRISEDKIISTEELYKELIEMKNDIFLAGDYAKAFYNDFGSEKFILSPAHLRLQLATSLCFSAMKKELCTPENINARYLQTTQAEKIRLNTK